MQINGAVKVLESIKVKVIKYIDNFDIITIFNEIVSKYPNYENVPCCSTWLYNFVSAIFFEKFCRNASKWDKVRIRIAYTISALVKDDQKLFFEHLSILDIFSKYLLIGNCGQIEKYSNCQLRKGVVPRKANLLIRNKSEVDAFMAKFSDKKSKNKTNRNSQTPTTANSKVNLFLNRRSNKACVIDIHKKINISKIFRVFHNFNHLINMNDIYITCKERKINSVPYNELSILYHLILRLRGTILGENNCGYIIDAFCNFISYNEDSYYIISIMLNLIVVGYAVDAAYSGKFNSTLQIWAVLL